MSPTCQEIQPTLKHIKIFQVTHVNKVSQIVNNLEAPVVTPINA